MPEPRSMKETQRRQRLKRYAQEIPLFEARIKLAEQRNEGAAYIRRLERMIDHRRKRLKDGWPSD